MISYILFLIARTAVILASPFGLIYTTIRRVIKGKANTLGSYYLDMGYVYDVFINLCYGDFLNDIFGKWDAYPYGNKKETLSEVLGKNKELGTLKKAEAWVARQLNKLDKDHVEKAAKT